MKIIESLTPSEFILSILVILIYGILVIYWDAKRRRDKEKKDFELYKNWMLDLDEHERIYEEKY